MQRILDILIAALVLVLVSPLLLLVAVAIKLDSRGPVLFKQERVGRHFKPFRMYKFRTMVAGADRLGPGVTAGNDGRVTRVGRFIRDTKLDELPQLWNVLKGEMSLVGPRPYLEREIPEMGQQEGIILRVRPGITGIWQVTERNATGFDQRVQTDVEYVRNWSPWLDIYVLARTFLVVVEGTGS